MLIVHTTLVRIRVPKYTAFCTFQPITLYVGFEDLDDLDIANALCMVTMTRSAPIRHFI